MKMSLFRILVFQMALLSFVTPLVTLAQQNPAVGQDRQPVEVQATRDAERDVEAHINKPMWFVIGCLFPGFGLLGPYLHRPPIPTGRTIGKSPEYVAFYTDAYRAKMEKLQFQQALNGCFTGVIIEGCLVGLFLIVSGSD